MTQTKQRGEARGRRALRPTRRTGRKSNRSGSGTALIVGIMVLFGTISALPLFMTVNNAFKTVSEFYIYPPTIVVQSPTMSNFRILFDMMSSSWVPFTRYLFNTVFITFGGVLGGIFLCSLAAFPLAKHRAPGVKFLFSLITLSLMFPVMVSDLSNYMTVSALGWIDSYSAIIIPNCALPLNLFLLRQFMIQLPDDMLSAARIDGASEYGVLFRVVLPNVRSAWLTITILTVQQLWNMGSSPYIFREELKTLPYAMGQIIAGGIVRAGPGAVAAVVLLIVPIILFLFTQSQIMETMVASGIKE